MDDNPHFGHRERLKKRFVEHGLDGFNDINALELLLFYSIPRQDTNVIAHRLIERFGNIDGVFSASLRELTEVPGVGESSAVLITMIPQLYKKALISNVGELKVISSPSAAGRYFMPRLSTERDEVLLMLCLDSQRRIIACREVNRGVVNSVAVDIRKLVEIALHDKASSVIIAHNHPDGTDMFSVEDELVTRQISDALKLLKIELADHILVCKDSYLSYKDIFRFR